MHLPFLEATAHNKCCSVAACVPWPLDKARTGSGCRFATNGCRMLPNGARESLSLLLFPRFFNAPLTPWQLIA